MKTKIVKIDPRKIKLLEVNARFMSADEFQKLVANVKRDGCLTQLPFCVYNDDGELEVLLGNHRVQAAIEAGLKEIDDVKKILDTAMKEVRQNETITLRMKEYDKYLDTLNDVSKASRIKNTAVGFMAMLDVVNNHMEELKSVWLDKAKDKEYVPLSTIIGRSDIKAKDGRIIDKAIERLVSKGEIKKTDKEDALAVLANKYLESEEKAKELKKQKKE